MLDPVPPSADIEWETGTVLDEFTPIYRALAVPTKTHRGFAPHEVDLMDLTTVALLLGVGTDPMANMLDEMRNLAARRAAGEDVTWGDT